jgi:hypothetical protein
MGTPVQVTKFLQNMRSCSAENIYGKYGGSKKMNIEDQAVSLVNSPRPFWEIPKLWLQLGRMTEAFFTNELSHTGSSSTIYGVLTYTVISTLLSVVQFILGSFINFLTSPTTAHQTDLAMMVGSMAIFLCCFGLIVTPISFYLNNGITYVGAQLFGGTGKFSSQAYLSSLFFVPLGFILSLIAFISPVPKVGIYIFSACLLGVAIFNMFLTIRSFKVVHHLSTGRATAAVLLPSAILLIPICIIAVLILAGPVIGNVFSEINTGLSTPAP